MPVSQRAASSSRASAAVRGGLHRPRGVGLVEVLVAVLILAVGLLGITLVQTRSLGNSNSAMGRSMAVVATYSILEAMRVDRANAVAASLPYNQTVAAHDLDDAGRRAALCLVHGTAEPVRSHEFHHRHGVLRDDWRLHGHDPVR